MNRRSAVRVMAAAGAGSLLSRLLAAAPRDQEDPHDQPEQSDQFLFRSEARLVLLDVSVESHDGGPVSGLGRDNFKVFEDNRPQPITVFGHNDLPVTVGIVVDESRSMSPKRPAVLTAALTFIAESNPSDQVFVLNFNDTVKAGLPPSHLFSDNPQELRQALMNGLPEGRTALYDAVIDGLDQLERGQRDKKALVVISDGGDNMSRHTRRETLDRIQRSIATIYTVGVFDDDDPDRDPGILRDLAHISGGRVFFPNSASETVPVCRRIAHDIRERYTVGYLPPPLSSGANPLRHVRVEVSARGHGGLMARTRTSYRYDENEARNERTGKPKAK